MKAIKIKMKRNCGNSGNVQDIDSIYIDQTSTYWKKSEVYDYLQKFPKTITVNISPYPYLIPAVSSQGEKYVRSVANSTSKDNLMMFTTGIMINGLAARQIYKSNIFSVYVLR